jgi:hypothetical protein
MKKAKQPIRFRPVGHFDRSRGRAGASPVWWGRDAASTWRSTFVKFWVDIPGIAHFFEIDLGRAWQAPFTPLLLDAGFHPGVMLPGGGRGDVGRFKYAAGGGHP